MDTESKATFFDRGIPTEPDVRALRKHFPDSMIKTGVSISYYEVARIIDAQPGTSRFKTVTNRWRSELEKDTGFVIGAYGDECFTVMAASQINTASKKKLRSASRAVKRSIVLTKRIDRNELNADERKQLDYTQRANGIIMAAMQTASKAKLPTIEDMTQKGNQIHEAV